MGVRLAKRAVKKLLQPPLPKKNTQVAKAPPIRDVEPMMMMMMMMMIIIIIIIISDATSFVYKTTNDILYDA